MFHKILCPIDFSPGADQALHLAIRIAAATNPELVIAHVSYMPPLAYAGEYPLPVNALEQMVQDEERGLASAAADATKLGAARVSTQLLRGVPWDQISEAVRADAAIDLVVIGTHGRTGLAHVLLGSVAEKVVRHAPCSVLTVRPGREVTAFGRVLCAVDFSDSSRDALALAAGLATHDVTLLHVIEPPAIYSEEPVVPGFLEPARKAAAQLLDRAAEELRRKVALPVTTRLVTGRSGASILSALDDDSPFDLVVVGSHGRTGIKRALLGSVAEKVVRHAACPVLVARSRS